MTSQLRVVVAAEGRRAAGRVRVTFEAEGSKEATRQLEAVGATVGAGPTVMPWKALNGRLEAPAGLHLTLCQELG